MRVTRETRQELVLTGGGRGFAVVGFIVAALAGSALFSTWLSPMAVSSKIVSSIPACVFLAVGLLLLLGRTKIEFNGVMGKAEKWWGFWPSVKFGSKAFPLSDVDRVRIDTVMKKSGKSSRPSYPVILSGKGRDFEIASSFQYLESRLIAEAVARFWNVPLHDRSEGTLVVRQPDSLNESLADRAARNRGKEELPPKPAGMTSAVADDGKTLDVTVPAMGFTVFHKVALAGAGGLFVFLVFGNLFSGGARHGQNIAEWLVFNIGPFNFMLAAAMLVVAQHALERTEITATEKVLRVQKIGLVSRKPIKMRADAIEEIFATPSSIEIAAKRPGGKNFESMLEIYKKMAASRSRIVARSDKKVATVAVPVPLAEAEYIAALITARLSGLK